MNQIEEVKIHAFINGGYPLRIFLGICNSICKTRTNIQFTPKGFNLFATNSDSTFTGMCSVDADDIIRYVFNSDENIELAIGTSTSGRVMSTCTKKHNASLTLWPNNLTFFYESVLSDNTDALNNSGSSITSWFDPFPRIKFPVYAEPNVKIPASSFSSKIGVIMKSAPTTIQLIPYEKGLRIAGLDSIGMGISLADMGTCEDIITSDIDDNNDSDDEDDDIPIDINSNNIDISNVEKYSIEISSDNLRALSKVGNACDPSSLVRIYMGSGLPITIKTRLGTYATAKYTISQSH